MEIDHDTLRTGIAIGCRASHALCSNCLLDKHWVRICLTWIGYIWLQ